MKPAGIGLVVCSILFPSLAFFVLSLRLLARQSRNVGLKLEDGLIGAAWVSK